MAHNDDSQSPRARYFAKVLAATNVRWKCYDTYDGCAHPECYRHSSEMVAAAIEKLERNPAQVTLVSQLRTELAALRAHEATIAALAEQMNEAQRDFFHGFTPPRQDGHARGVGR